MARMPGATWLGPHHDNGEMARYDIVCVHTIVGYAPAHAAHFSVKADGTIFQSRDTRYRSAANKDGNHRVIAIENEDLGPAFPSWSGSNVPALTGAQVTANAKIAAWCYEEHKIPLVAARDSKPGTRGVGYHRLGIDGNFGSFDYGGRVSGGEEWSTSFGKVCPGDKRIRQVPEIIERARVLAEIEEDEMQLGDRVKLTDRQSAYFNGLPSISVQGLLVYGAMGGFRGPQTDEDVDDILREVLEAEQRDLAGGA